MGIPPPSTLAVASKARGAAAMRSKSAAPTRLADSDGPTLLSGSQVKLHGNFRDKSHTQRAVVSLGGQTQRRHFIIHIILVGQMGHISFGGTASE